MTHISLDSMTNKIICGDAPEALQTLPDESAQCIVTSPPYWGLRDYGVDEQIGLEQTPECYISKMVQVFSECRRVLRGDGTLWLNIGDSYANGGGKTRDPPGVKPKDLIGIPWMLAFALREDGWYLRQDIIWHKPNPMPESVHDRCTKAHEYLFLLSKSEHYSYDANAIKEPVTGNAHLRCNGANRKILLGGDHPRNVDCRYHAPGMREHTGLRKKGLQAKHSASSLFSPAEIVDDRMLEKSEKRPSGWHNSDGYKGQWPGKPHLPDTYRGSLPGRKDGPGQDRRSTRDRAPGVTPKSAPIGSGVKSNDSFHASCVDLVDFRNKRSVWTIPTRGFKEAHFATFPPDLVKPCVLAGSHPGDVVLDPFMGSGTVAVVSKNLGRRYIGIELNPEYVAIAERRIARETAQMHLFTQRKSAYES